MVKAPGNDAAVIDELPDLLKSIIGKNNVIIGVGNDDANMFDDCIKSFVEKLPTVEISDELAVKPWDKSNDAIVIPGDIAFSGMTCSFEDMYRGSTLLMSHIVSLDYLWNEVRVKGGAYGTGFKIQPNGSLMAYSYRDPNAGASVKTFGKISQYIREFVKSDRKLIGFIIGAMSSATPLLTPRLISTGGDSNYIRGLDEATRLRTRQEIVATSLDDLMSLADKVDDALSTGAFCIIGSQKQVDSLENIDNKYSL